MELSRRSLLTGAATTLAFAGLARHAWAIDPDAPQTTEMLRALPYTNEVTGYGPLVPDPQALFDLPAGFSYRMFSTAGETMSDGLLVPHKHDGMAAFPGPDGLTRLVRNHEVKAEDLDLGACGPGRTLAAQIPPQKIYDHTQDGLPMTGGTTTLLYDTRSQRLVSHHLSLAGTTTNCAGGATPRNTWLTCEETVQRRGQGCGRDHGYVFEVPADASGLVDPQPILEMGRFRHEATATDPRTGIVYLTEDMGDGFGLFYRYLPHDPNRLLAGGRLQALALPEGERADPRNWIVAQPYWRAGETRPVHWVDLQGLHNPDNTMRDYGHHAGAAWFARGEGIHFGRGELFFACTAGGPDRLGQIFRYTPSPREGHPDETAEPGRLQLFVEPHDPALMNMCDNITVSPMGHLMVCEDKLIGANFLKGVTPQGQIYTLGRNPRPWDQSNVINSELAGVCFSPDGSTLFVNLQWPGQTFAITGPWASFRT